MAIPKPQSWLQGTRPEDDGVTGDSAGLPGAGAEFVNQLDVAESGDEGDDDTEDNECYSRPEGEAGGVCVGG